MIRNESEYRRALENLERDAEATALQRRQLQSMGIEGEELERAMEPVESFSEQLKDEIEVYERMCRGDVGALRSLTTIGQWLVGLRIARGWNQKQLADMLGVSEAQVSRDERHEYYGVTVERAQKILETLGVEFEMVVVSPVIKTDPVEQVTRSRDAAGAGV